MPSGSDSVTDGHVGAESSPCSLSPAAGLPELLPLYAYERTGEGQGVFVNADLSIGAVWELSPIEAEVLEPDALGQLSLSLETIFRALPELEAAAQFILVSRPGAHETIGAWHSRTDPHAPAILRELASARSSALRRGRSEEPGGVFLARSIRVYLTLRLLTPPRTWSLIDRLSAAAGDEGILASIEREHEGRIRKVENLAGAIERSLRSAQVGFRRLDANDLVALMYPLLNPTRAGSTNGEDIAPTYTGRLPISDLVARSPMTFDPGTGVIELDGRHNAVLSVLELPLSCRAGELWRGVLAHPAAVADELFVATFNIWIPSQDKVARSLKLRQLLSFRHKHSAQSGTNAEATVLHEDIEDLQREIAREGRRVAKAQIVFRIAAASDQALASRVAALESKLRSLSIEAKPEDAYAETLFLQSLPLAFEPETDDGMLRARTLTSLNLAHLIPAHSPMRGTRTPDMLLQNRLGEPINFSFFDVDGAAHGIVLGSSGGGKSFLMNNLVTSVMRRGARVFIIDKGAADRDGSYEKLCRFMGGRYVKLDPDNVRSLNPFGAVQRFDDFSRVLPNNRRLFLGQLVGRMITRGTRLLTIDERGVLDEAIEAMYRAAFTGRSSKALLLSDLHACLLARGGGGGGGAQSDPVAQSLARGLGSWIGDGPYARFFDRPCDILADNDNDDAADGEASSPLAQLVVFEVADNEGWQEVATVVLMAILNLVAKVSSRERGRDKYLLIDEAWTLLQGADTAAFLVGVAKTYRKLRTALVLATQQIVDLAGPLGRAIQEEAQNRIFCRQLPDTIRRTAEELNMTQAEESAFASLDKVDGKYSEALILAPGTRGVVRYAPSSLEYWTFTSSPQDNEALLRLQSEMQARGGEPDPARAALLEAARRWPRGLDLESEEYKK